MFRPTQTVPSKLTALTIVVGFILAISLLAIAVLNSTDTSVPQRVRAEASQSSGIMVITALLIFAASIRPLAGGILLCAMAIAIFAKMPVPAVIAFAFSMLALLRAYLSRRHLAKKS